MNVLVTITFATSTGNNLYLLAWQKFTFATSTLACLTVGSFNYLVSFGSNNQQDVLVTILQPRFGRAKHRP